MSPPSHRRPGSDPRSVQVQFAVDKVPLGRGFIRELPFTLQCPLFTRSITFTQRSYKTRNLSTSNADVTFLRIQVFCEVTSRRGLVCADVSKERADLIFKGHLELIYP